MLAVLPVTVVNQIAKAFEESPAVSRFVARDLAHPLAGRVGCDSCDLDSARSDVDEEEHEVGDESGVGPDFDREEVGRGKHVLVRIDELLPRRLGLTFGSRLDAVALENVADRRVADLVAELLEGAGDSVVAPGGKM